ncbi:MAG: hypothetical protein ONB17_07065 [candidate division KSB1 bacterium]|nr:hypothetical protein [candidate division KSB1 bacterium]MDZ7295429.1 hypothetical protein [candidate division KSB1 bacterium]MDZ7386743.1 hypothetical protein [candidate division KSB1 bacterium]MDZ7392006.1 hypothetical protein [candidate division KSB1 bacterium]MDZ7412823.1 hypothetical protein [candidate division KSB1 bacterium]
MPFCPSCSYEYIEGTKVCPECRVRLVADLPSVEEAGEAEEWVALPSLPGTLYAEMVREALLRAGIPASIRQDVVSGALGSKGLGAVGSQAVLVVPKRHRRRAAAILHQMLNHI